MQTSKLNQQHFKLKKQGLSHRVSLKLFSDPMLSMKWERISVIRMQNRQSRKYIFLQVQINMHHLWTYTFTQIISKLNAFGSLQGGHYCTPPPQTQPYCRVSVKPALGVKSQPPVGSSRCSTAPTQPLHSPPINCNLSSRPLQKLSKYKSLGEENKDRKN